MDCDLIVLVGSDGGRVLKRLPYDKCGFDIIVDADGGEWHYKPDGVRLVSGTIGLTVLHPTLIDPKPQDPKSEVYWWPIMVYDPADKDHVNHVQQVCERLTQEGLLMP